jgi:undecaprenyl-diphosphatase
MAAPSLRDERLLAGHRAVGGIVAVSAAVLLLLGSHYAGDYRPGWVDHAIDARVRRHLRGHLDTLHDLVSLADPASIVAICALLAALFFVTGRRRAVVLAAVGPAAAVGFTEFVLKPLVGRRLGAGLAFPSGHTTAAVSVALVVVVVLLGPSRPRWPAAARWAASALALACAAMVAVALVGSGYHYATDTIGGFCVATTVVPAVAWLIDVTADGDGPGDAADVPSDHEVTRAR